MDDVRGDEPGQSSIAIAIIQMNQFTLLLSSHHSSDLTPLTASHHSSDLTLLTVIILKI
jgi:hypothetical protein